MTTPDKLLAALLHNPRAQARNTRGIHAQGRCVVYWMQRAQRTADNPALDAAIEAANLLKLPVCIFFAPRAGYPNANLRAYAFLADNLADLGAGALQRGVKLVFRPGTPSLLRFCAEVDPALVVVDENPLREPQRWRQKAAAALNVALISVDADAVVPMRLFPKQEFAARTLRPKVHRILGDFMVPSREPHAITPWPADLTVATEPLDAKAFLAALKVDRSVGAAPGMQGGMAAGARMLGGFIRGRLKGYAEQRNKPDLRGTSELSAYLHFGHLGPRGIALAVRAAEAPQADKDAFLEEMIVRRELAMNFCLHEPHYDTLAGCPEWARKELADQASVTRNPCYTAEQFERAETHDPLWNAGQKEMVLSGRMHGYVRMYWAKKILEWTRSAEEAFSLAVHLNDKYEVDGRDPNGYTGVAWAIGGRHDRPWAPRRPVFGTVRWMSLASTGKKFNLKGYVARVHALEHGPTQPALL